MNLEKAIDILENVIADEVIGIYCLEIQKEVECSKNCENEDCFLQQAIDTVLQELDTRYNKGYQDGFKQAKFEVEMDKLQEEMTVSELKRIIKEYTESHDLYIVTDCSFFEIVEDAINIAKEIKEGNNEQI